MSNAPEAFSRASRARFRAKAASLTLRSASSLAAAAAFRIDWEAMVEAARRTLAEVRSRTGEALKKRKEGLEQVGHNNRHDREEDVEPPAAAAAQVEWERDGQLEHLMMESEGGGPSKTSKQLKQKEPGWFFRTQPVQYRRWSPRCRTWWRSPLCSPEQPLHFIILASSTNPQTCPSPSPTLKP